MKNQPFVLGSLAYSISMLFYMSIDWRVLYLEGICILAHVCSNIPRNLEDWRVGLGVGWQPERICTSSAEVWRATRRAPWMALQGEFGVFTSIHFKCIYMNIRYLSEAKDRRQPIV